MKKAVNYFFLFQLIVLFYLIPVTTAAQSVLERVSITERGDQKGLVVRHHITERADSFKVVQPNDHLIQVMIYSRDLRTSGFTRPEMKTGVDRFEYHQTEEGFGLDIFLEEGYYFKSNAYYDHNRSHILLNLEKSDREAVALLTRNIEKIYWYDVQDQTATFDYTFDEAGNDSFIPLTNGRDFSVIVIDAGHGGKDPGALNQRLGIREKDVALAVALKVGEYIKEHMPEVEVIYTRDDDTFVELQERGLTSTRSKGDLFLSIHANAARNTQAYGAEVFFLGLARSQSALEVMKRENSVVHLENGGGPVQLSEEELLIYELANAGNIAISERIASMIEEQFRVRAQRRSRGVKQAPLMALWHASTPAVLVELGFISNTTEGQYLASEYGQNILASAIFRAVRDFKTEYDKSMQHLNRASNER